MTQRFVEGKNYEIDVTGAFSTCRVWSRRDLDSSDAAKYVAVVAASNAMQQLQLRRIVATFAPDYGKLFDVARQAEEWLAAKGPKAVAPAPKQAPK